MKSSMRLKSQQGFAMIRNFKDISTYKRLQVDISLKLRIIAKPCWLLSRIDDFIPSTQGRNFCFCRNRISVPVLAAIHFSITITPPTPYSASEQGVRETFQFLTIFFISLNIQRFSQVRLAYPPTPGRFPKINPYLSDVPVETSEPIDRTPGIPVMYYLSLVKLCSEK